MTCQCFLSSAISVVIPCFTRSRHLSFGLPRFRFPSTVIWNIFIVVSDICFPPMHMSKPSQPLVYEEFCHGVGLHVCLFPYVYISHVTKSRLSHLAHRNMRLLVMYNCPSPFFLTAQQSDPYTIAGFIAVLYTVSFNFVGMLLSHITPVVSPHVDQANNAPRNLNVFTIVTSFS